MKKFMVILPISAMTLFVSLPTGANAQLAFLEVIKAGVKKVIKAMDLKVQRLQNETIWLQNAQKVLENQLSKLKLGEIAEWTSRQKELYGQYYQELWKVKSAIVQYKRLGEMGRQQARIVEEYRWAWNLFSKSGHFSPQELLVMEKVYSGILEQSVKNVDGILSVVGSFRTQMTDGDRLELIVAAAGQIEQNWQDLKRFNRESGLLSIQRARSLEEAAKLRELYGIVD
ncbi:MAG: conjugal transfer protein TraI [Pseudomonas sp.]|nr:MAG: conjugal transfer protein TraI [Pseudomonas sp.]